ncbi:hypothetical protein ABZ922_40875 [Streptomyces shenzhenensis]
MFTTPTGRPIDTTDLTRTFSTLPRDTGLRRIQVAVIYCRQAAKRSL